MAFHKSSPATRLTLINKELLITGDCEGETTKVMGEKGGRIEKRERGGGEGMGSEERKGGRGEQARERSVCRSGGLQVALPSERATVRNTSSFPLPFCCSPSSPSPRNLPLYPPPIPPSLPLYLPSLLTSTPPGEGPNSQQHPVNTHPGAAAALRVNKHGGRTAARRRWIHFCRVASGGVEGWRDGGVEGLWMYGLGEREGLEVDIKIQVRLKEVGLHETGVGHIDG